MSDFKVGDNVKVIIPGHVTVRGTIRVKISTHNFYGVGNTVDETEWGVQLHNTAMVKYYKTSQLTPDTNYNPNATCTCGASFLYAPKAAPGHGLFCDLSKNDG